MQKIAQNYYCKKRGFRVSGFQQLGSRSVIEFERNPKIKLAGFSTQRMGFKKYETRGESLGFPRLFKSEALKPEKNICWDKKQ